MADPALALPTDEPAVVDLLLAQLAEHALPAEREAVEGAVRGMLARPDRGLHPRRAQGGARRARRRGVGLLHLEPAGLTSWLEELYVLPPLRDRGLGGALLGASLARAREAGCAAMDLEVTDDHARAARLYLRAGFERLGRTRYVRRG
jgi:GNAT superfamily N-acetyltransferase